MEIRRALLSWGVICRDGGTEALLRWGNWAIYRDEGTGPSIEMGELGLYYDREGRRERERGVLP